MKRTSHNKWLISIALVVCGILLVLQSSLYYTLESRNARFVSPNYLDITMIRLQRLHKLQGNSVIMGSSITERLMASPTTAVIGIPSSSFTAGLKLLDGAVRFPADTTYILETNNLFNGIYEPVLNDAMKWDFRFFRNSPHFSIAAKPTNLLLSTIYLFQRGNSSANNTSAFDTPILAPVNLADATMPTAQELAEWNDVLNGVEQIRRQGGRICLVQFPTKDTHRFDEAYAKALKLAKHLNIPVLNYNTDEWRERLVFTDPRHLQSLAPSTALFRETIARDADACAR